MGETRPWWEDDTSLKRQLLAHVSTLERDRLDRFPHELRSPGAYLVFLCAPRLTGAVSPIYSYGTRPVHIGKAKCLAERAGRYRNLGFLEPRELFIAPLPTASEGAAAHCEAILQHTFHPLMTGSGFSSKVCGTRRQPRPSMADCLLGPRSWASQPSLVEEACARLRVVSHLARLDPAGERWPALTDGASTDGSTSSQGQNGFAPDSPTFLPVSLSGQLHYYAALEESS